MPIASTLAPGAVFAIEPDGAEPQRLARAFRTDVMTTESGVECRVALRTVPVRRFEMTPKFVSAREAMHFRALWLATAESGAQRLRFVVPLWPRQAEPTAFPDASTITCDTRSRGFVAGGQALLTASDDVYELVDLADDGVADDALSLAAPISDTSAYPLGITRVIPVMLAWLDPPTIDQRGPTAAQAPLVFREEMPGVAGADATAGLAIVPDVSSVVARRVASGTEWAGRKYTTLEAEAYDNASMPILDPPVTWNITDLGASSSPVVLKPYGGRQLHLAYDGGTATAFHVTATVGGVTSGAVPA